MSGRNEVIKKSKRISDDLSTKEYLKAEKTLIERLRKQKNINEDFLSQIENFIGYAKKQAEVNDEEKLELKYEEIIEEEESLRDKIKEHLKKNDELIKSIQKSNFES